MSDLEPVRIGRLIKMALSPAHFHADEPEEGSEEADEEQTASMELGSLLHAVVLKGSTVVVSPCRRDPRMKQYQEFLAANVGNLIVTKTQARHIEGMAESLLADPVAPRLLQGVHEQTLFWDWMGRRCRGTPDVRSDWHLAELKTTRCSKPELFIRDAERRHYHTQLAWYDSGCMRAGGDVPACYRELWAVAVESKPPYAVTCLQMEEDVHQDADRSIRLWFERLLQCEAAGHWPAYTQVPVKWNKQERPWMRETQAIDAEALA